MYEECITFLYICAIAAFFGVNRYCYLCVCLLFFFLINKTSLFEEQFF